MPALAVVERLNLLEDGPPGSLWGGEAGGVKRFRMAYIPQPRSHPTPASGSIVNSSSGRRTPRSA